MLKLNCYNTLIILLLNLKTEIMKTKFLTFALALFFYSQFSISQIKMASNGYVKIGSTASPTKTLDVAGHVIVIP